MMDDNFNYDGNSYGGNYENRANRRTILGL